MSYQVLARKWRPQSFDELIGQEPIVRALENALRDGRVAQAYLFSGIRGVGKTTAARLLARALNLGLDHVTGDGDERTGEILPGGQLDVIEVDAATYSKVEQVRELTETLLYKPAHHPYKVVIIDEIHRLSRQAFDALLKIVEEPPDHLVFIFATTEIEAVPATILSRCQEFHFLRVPADELVSHLRRISDAESIEVSDTALRLIARAGEGSVRDSVALLDQLSTFGGGSVDDESAARLLGGLDHRLFETVLGAMFSGDGQVVSDAVREIESRGWDPRSAYSQFLSYCRDGLHLALGADEEHVELPADERRHLRELARRAGYQNLLRLLHQLLQSETLIRRSEIAGLALEIAWLRAAELPRLLEIERVLAGGPPESAADGGPNGPNDRGSGAREARSASSESRSSTETPSARPSVAPASTPSESVPPSAETSVEPATAESVAASEPASEGLEQEREDLEAHPTVQAVLEIFDGSIESVVDASEGGSETDGQPART